MWQIAYLLEIGETISSNRALLCFPLVYLNVTDLTTYNVGYDSFCIRWAPHRAATSYRLKVYPFDSMYFTQWGSC